MGLTRYLRIGACHLGFGPDPRSGRRRRPLARRYLSGRGLEIGALHEPLWVPPDVAVDYVDYRTRAESIAAHPELEASRIVEPRYVENGFTLASIPDASQDFVIANHVLEHAANPLGVLQAWARVLKPDGVLFVTVPIAENCFDRGRRLTSAAHLVEDFELVGRGEIEEFRRRNRDHVREWLTISQPALFRQQGAEVRRRTAEELEQAIDGFDESADIHFHTFSPVSFREALVRFGSEIVPGMRIEGIATTKEVTAILRKPA